MQHPFSELCCALGLCASLVACSAESVQPKASALVIQKQTAQPSAAALREVLSRAGATVKVIKRPDGLTQIDTLHGFHSASVAHRGPDGRVEQTCIHTAEELDHMMAQDNGVEP
jgi:hypothetical protein